MRGKGKEMKIWEPQRTLVSYNESDGHKVAYYEDPYDPFSTIKTWVFQECGGVWMVTVEEHRSYLLDDLELPLR